MSDVEASGRIESLKGTELEDSTKYNRWRDEITAAEKESKKFHERGRKVERRYKDERTGDDDSGDKKFNLFTTNVGIMKSALYSHVPKVLAERRFHDADDDVARVASIIIQRAITQDLDEVSCDFSQVMEDAIEDRLVPGAGFAWVRLVVETEQVPAPAPEIPPGMPGMDIPEPAEPEMLEQISKQEVVVEHVHWEDFIWSPCRTWAERRWVGRKVYMDKDALVARFGAEKAATISLDYQPKSEDSSSELNDVLKKAVIYEIWDRTTRTVVWLNKGNSRLLDERYDPLRLEGFEPCPKPLFALTTTSKCIPTADYYLIQDQYKELDDVNNRISMLNDALRVSGVYDKGADGIQNLLNIGGNNQLVPVDNWAMFAEKGGIKGSIDWLPLDAIVQALGHLRTARDDIKGQIYELNGISDVVRGTSAASETLGAQQIKANFANIRIQREQAAAARFASEIFRIKAEIIAKHVEPNILLKMSNILLTPDGQNQELVQAALELIKSDEEFEWRISVDADSMKMADYAAEKKERTEFVTSVATYLQSAATILKDNPTASPLLLGMLKYAAAGYSGSKDMEALIDKSIQDYEKAAAEPKEPPVDPKVEAMKLQAQLDQQAAELNASIKQQDAAAKAQRDQQELMFAQQRHDQEMAFARQEHEQRMQIAREQAAVKNQVQQTQPQE